MSKDMLGSVVRAAVGVSQQRCELLAMIASDISTDNPYGAEWYARYEAAREQGLENAAGFLRNKHGHIVVSVTASGFTGAGEVQHLVETKTSFNTVLVDLLTSRTDDGYDAKHHFKAGEVCKLTIVPNKDIPAEIARTPKDLCDFVQKSFGYGKPLAEHLLRLRDVLPVHKIKQLGIEYFWCLHDSLRSADTGRVFLVLGHRDSDSVLYIGWKNSVEASDEKAAFVFVAQG